MYLTRPAEFETVSLYEWFLWISRCPHNSFGRRQQERVVGIWPAYQSGEAGTTAFESWCRAKILLQHHHRAEQELLHNNKTWSEAWERCQVDHPEEHTGTLPKQQRIHEGGDAEQSKSEWETEEEEDERELEDFLLLCLEGGRAGDGIGRSKDLGRRDMDRAEDWLVAGRALGDEEVISLSSYLDDSKKTVSINPSTVDVRTTIKQTVLMSTWNYSIRSRMQYCGKSFNMPNNAGQGYHAAQFGSMWTVLLELANPS